MKQIVITKKLTILSFTIFLLNAIALEMGGKILLGYSALPKLDFRISGYNIADLNQYFNILGDSGRETYFWLNVLDTPFPFLLAFFGFCYFSFTWKKWNIKPLYFLLITASFSFMIFDSVENISIYSMLYSFPALSMNIISISSLATQIKLYSLFVVYGALPITLIISIIRYLKNWKANKK